MARRDAPTDLDGRVWPASSGTIIRAAQISGVPVALARDCVARLRDHRRVNAYFHGQRMVTLCVRDCPATIWRQTIAYANGKVDGTGWVVPDG